MQYEMIHRSPGRFHINFHKQRLSEAEADVLYYNLIDMSGVTDVTVYQRTAQLAVRYDGRVAPILENISDMDLTDPVLMANVPSVSARATNESFKTQLLDKVIGRVARWIVLPAPVRAVIACVKAVPFCIHCINQFRSGESSADIIHGAAVVAALLTREFGTASSVMFLTEIGELLEQWTYKKSVDDLAQSLALNVEKVWRVADDGTEEQIGLNKMRSGDKFRATMGSMIALDGKVVSGEALVNQSVLTGEPLAVRKTAGDDVYAGTVVEEGDLVVAVSFGQGENRYDKIVNMIENSENMAALTQTKAASVADKLVPWTFGLSLAAFAFTGDPMKAASILMADFSCAVEVAMPIAVLSAMREAGKHNITVKGGKFLESIAEADTIVFDKTGTLTNATPVVEEVLAMDGRDADDMLTLAADLEEHFPHSLANAVVKKAAEKGLQYDERHGKAEYIVAHGIASDIDGTRVVIGSYHFVVEDEGVALSDEDQAKIDAMPATTSKLYLAIGGKLAAVIAIADPLKPETPDVIRRLKAAGFNNIVMMTGDSRVTAQAIAKEAGITEVHAEVLPEDKARYVKEQKAKGRKVIMIGDGINDSPALSEADVGVAIKEGADIAQEIADVTLSGSDLAELITLRKIADKLMTRMHSTYVIGNTLNGAILGFGFFGLITPNTGALLHNVSTIGLCLRNMQDLEAVDDNADRQIEDAEIIAA